MRGSRACAVAATLACLVFAGSGAAAPGESARRVGAYCPLPEPGQKPACLEPAEARYSEFFDAVDQGALDASTAEALEADLRSEQAGYLALSSVAYAYFRLARHKAENPALDPQIAAQLERWNAMLSSLYEDARVDPDFRSAVRQAAVDLDTRVPDAGVMAAIEAVDARLSMRDPIARLLERAFGGTGQP